MDSLLELPGARPMLALAPMQEVTDLAFWRVIHRRGDPDLYFTEYARVHATSRPESERGILRAIDENPTGRPVAMQLIGRDIPALVHAARFFQRRAVAAIDLNLGCPAPVVCSKNAGGGLLRNPGEIDAILSALRQAVDEKALTVKTRVGFDHPDEFDRLLEVFGRHAIDLLSVHGRTVRDGYRTAVHHERIARAASALSFPVLANGNVVSVATALRTLRATGAAGLMIGRGVIRNPFLFAQVRAALEGGEVPAPRRCDILSYIEDLYAETRDPSVAERLHVTRMKRYMNFVAQGIDDGIFLHRIKRVENGGEFFAVCRDHLDDPAPVPPEPPSDNPVFAGLAA